MARPLRREGAPCHVSDAVDRPDRGTTELLNDEGHGEGPCVYTEPRETSIAPSLLPLAARSKAIESRGLSSYAAYVVETFVTLAVVCGLAFLVLWGGRRLGLGRATGPVELRGYLPLEGRRAVYLVQVGEKVFVVAVGEGGFTKLGEMPASELPATEKAAAIPPFAQVFARALARGKEPPR